MAVIVLFCYSTLQIADMLVTELDTVNVNLSYIMFAYMLQSLPSARLWFLTQKNLFLNTILQSFFMHALFE